MHPEQAEFEKKIDENPLDSNTHAVYADWLDDHGQHDEAAFRRSMGEWMSHPGRNTQWNSLSNGEFYAHRHDLPAGVRDTTFTVHEGRLPREDEDPSAARRGSGGYTWRNYRGMENAFRNSFMAFRKTSLARKILPRRYFRVK